LVVHGFSWFFEKSGGPYSLATPSMFKLWLKDHTKLKHDLFLWLDDVDRHLLDFFACFLAGGALVLRARQSARLPGAAKSQIWGQQLDYHENIIHHLVVSNYALGRPPRHRHPARIRGVLPRSPSPRPRHRRWAPALVSRSGGGNPLHQSPFPQPTPPNTGGVAVSLAETCAGCKKKYAFKVQLWNDEP